MVLVCSAFKVVVCSGEIVRVDCVFSVYVCGKQNGRIINELLLLSVKVIGGEVIGGEAYNQR